MYACKALGPSTIGNYEKNGAMLHYIKVLLRTPAECMQNGTCKMEKREDEEICVGQLFLSSAASQRCWRFGNSNFFVVEMILGFWCIQLVRLGVTYRVEYGGMWHFLFLHRKVEPLFIYFFDYFFITWIIGTHTQPGCMFGNYLGWFGSVGADWPRV